MSDPDKYQDDECADDDDAEAWWQYWQDRLGEEREIGDPRKGAA